MAEDKKQSPVPEAHTTPEAPAPKTPGGPAVEEQATIPGMESGPAPSGKRKAQDEGIVKLYKQQMAFTSPAEERNHKAYRAKCKRKERMERRGK